MLELILVLFIAIFLAWCLAKYLSKVMTNQPMVGDGLFRWIENPVYVEVVNSTQTTDGYIALVVAKPAALQELGLQVLDLPEALSGDVARPQ